MEVIAAPDSIVQVSWEMEQFQTNFHSPAFSAPSSEMKTGMLAEAASGIRSTRGREFAAAKHRTELSEPHIRNHDGRLLRIQKMQGMPG